MGLTTSEAEGAVDIVLDAIADALVKEEAVRIAAFETFTTKSRAAQTGCNPRTEKSLPIPASKVPSFKPGKAIRDVVNGVRDGLGEKAGTRCDHALAAGKRKRLLVTGASTGATPSRRESVDPGDVGMAGRGGAGPDPARTGEPSGATGRAPTEEN